MIDLSKIGVKKNATPEQTPQAPAAASTAPAARPNPLANLIAKQRSGVAPDAGKGGANAPSSDDAGGTETGIREAIPNQVQTTSAVQAEAVPAAKPSASNALVTLNLSAGKGRPEVDSSLPEVETIPPGPDGFRARLDRLDSLIVADNGISALSLDTARKYVSETMKELLTHPEYDGLIIDTDVHNIMVFVRESMAVANKTFETKAEKSVKRNQKKQLAASFDFSGIEAIMNPNTAKSKAQSAVATGGIDALANLNLDDIKPILRR